MNYLRNLSIAGIAAVLTKSTVFAQAVQWQSSGCLKGPGGDVATIQCLVPMFQNVVSSLLQIAAVALFVMFVAGGFQFLTSGGNPKQTEQAKNTLTWAILGVVIMVVSFLIIQIIARFTGVQNLGTFTIPGSQN